MLNKLTSEKHYKVIFFNFFDSIITKNITDNQLLRLWSKNMIREVGIDLRIDELYQIRKETDLFLAKAIGKEQFEVPYKSIIDEVYTRLKCTNSITTIDKETFSNYFKNSDYKTEILVQEPNNALIASLKELKNKGFKLYCVANFKGSSFLIKKYLAYHGAGNIFDEIVVSSEYGHSTLDGVLYTKLLEELAIPSHEAAIARSSINDLQVNISETKIPIIALDQVLQVQKRNFDKSISDKKRYREIVRRLYKKCNAKLAPPHSDYILFYYVYIERLYKKAKKDNIQNICFLAREGFFLKKIFDYYQKEVCINEDNQIKTHYFKASRNSLMLASFKDIKIEEFEYLKRRWPRLSVTTFLKNFNLSEETVTKIIANTGLQQEKDKVLDSFLDSDIFERLKTNEVFIEVYNTKRNSQKKYFEAYLDSFDFDIRTEGMHISDVGWGGTMQNRLYDFFQEKVQIHGYYLGVREINNIRIDTIKYGLNFSVYPYINFFDHILMANVELNEQLLAAGHGSTIAYADKADSYTVEHHEKNDKRVYEEYIKETQDFMFKRFKELTKEFKWVCYDFDLEQYEMVDHALRIGLFANKRKTTREVNIYKGFYQNVGDFSVGLELGKNFGKKQKIEFIKNLFTSPEESFRYVLRIKPMLMKKNKYFLAYFIPSYLIYMQIKIRSVFKGLKPKKQEFNLYN